MHLDTNFFLFFYLFFSILYFFFLTFLFLFLFLFFSLLGARIRIRVMSQLHCHTSVTSDNTVTVTVTTHKVQTQMKRVKKMISRSILIVYLSHGIYMVYSWLMYGLQGKVNHCWHRPQNFYINSIGIQQRLLVKFSYDLYNDILLRDLLFVLYWSF